MTRNLTAGAQRAFRVDARDGQFITLMTVEHPQLDPAIRIACDTDPVTSNGIVYEGFPFDFSLMGDTEGVASVPVRVQNVDKRIGDGIMGLNGPAIVTLRVVLASEPDNVIYQVERLLLNDVRITSTTVEGNLVMESPERDPWPSSSATKTKNPALWYR